MRPRREVASPDFHRKLVEGAARQRRERHEPLATLARLRADITMLRRDFSVVAEPLGGVALVKQRFELRRDVFLAAGDLDEILESFERVSHAVAGSRHTCAVADMRRVKRHCAELRDTASGSTRSCWGMTVPRRPLAETGAEETVGKRGGFKPWRRPRFAGLRERPPRMARKMGLRHVYERRALCGDEQRSQVFRNRVE